MNNLMKYLNKRVELIDIDNKIWQGRVETYTPAIDTDEELYDYIALGLTTGELIEFCQNEIKEIKIID